MRSGGIVRTWAGALRAYAGTLRAWARQNRLFSIALAAGAFLRLIAMAGFPGTLWFAGDSYVYVGAALRPRPDLSKTTGYSFFLRALLPLHSFTLVAGLQHLMGLAIAILVYLLARRAGVSQRWATAAALPVLLDGFEIEDEHMVMAEALFTFLVVLSMALILWRVRVRWPIALLAGLLAGYAIIVRSEGLPVMVLFPLAIALRDRRQWRQWATAGVMAIGCVLPVGAYVAWFHHDSGTYGLTRSEGFYLWGRVSSFADCAVIKPPADEAKVCPTGPPSKRQPPGDYIWHFPPVHNIAGGPVSVANDALLRNFAIHAVEAQPFGYLGSVAKGVFLSVRWPRETYPDAGTVSYYYFHVKPQTVPANHSWIPGGTAYGDITAYGHAVPSRVVAPFDSLIAVYERVVYTYGPLFGLIMITGLGGVIRLRRGSGQGLTGAVRLVWSRRAGSMLPWITAVTLLVFPIAIADFDYRYLLPVLPFAGLAAALAFAPAARLEKWPHAHTPAQAQETAQTPPPSAEASAESSLSKG